MAKLEIIFEVNHPTASGHFPGNPIIPGALLLAEVLQKIAADNNVALNAGAVKVAKFLQPVRPGNVVHVDYSKAASGMLQFECSVAGKTVLTGTVDAKTW